MANDLRVGIVADASGLDPGLTAAQQQVVSAATAMAQAQNVAATATKNLAEAQLALGAAAAAGNEKAAAIIAEYSAASTSAAAAVSGLTEATAAQVPVMQEQAAATDAAAAATNVLGVSSRQAATAGIGILEGRMMSGNRAAAAFLSTTLGLGPVLQAAFPVIGALALGEVLGQIIKGMVHFGEEAQALSVELGTDWLSAALLQLSGFGDGIREQEKNIAEFERQIDQSIKKQKELAFADTGLREGKQAEGTSKAMDAGQRMAGLRAMIAGEEDLAKADRENADAMHIVANATSNVAGVSSIANAMLGKLGETVKEDEARLKALREELAQASLQSQHDVLQLPGEVPKEKKAPKDPTIRLFIEESIADYKRMEAYSKEITEAITAQWEVLNKDQIESLKQKEDAERHSAEESRRQREAEQAEGGLVAQATIQEANETFASAQQDIRMREEMGAVSHRVALSMIIDAQKVKESQVQGALGKQAGLYDPIEGGRELKEFTEIENRMTEEARKSSLERQKLTDQEAQKFVAEWKRASAEFNRDFTTAFNSILTKQESVSKAFGHMLGTMELQIVDFIAKWLMQQEEAHMLAKLSDAKTAAANAYTWASAWGGPPAGAIAAAVAFAAVDAFEMGGIVAGSGGSPVPIIAHAGERVLSAGQTSNFESMVNNGGNRSATLNQENHFDGGISDRQLAAHTAQTMTSLRRMLRPEAFA
jgi:hypothetical protein